MRLPHATPATLARQRLPRTRRPRGAPKPSLPMHHPESPAGREHAVALRVDPLDRPAVATLVRDLLAQHALAVRRERANALAVEIDPPALDVFQRLGRSAPAHDRAAPHSHAA